MAIMKFQIPKNRSYLDRLDKIKNLKILEIEDFLI